MTTGRQKAAEGTKRTLILAVLGIAVGMALFIASLVWILEHRGDVAKRICMGQVAQNEVLREVLLEARNDALREATTTRQAERIARDYDHYLLLVPKLECDEAGRPQKKERTE